MQRFFVYIFFSLISISLMPPVSAQSDFEFLLKDSHKYKNVVVQEVVSADTFIISDYTQKGERIRMIGLKAPETVRTEKKDIKRNEFGFVVEEPVGPTSSIEEKAFIFVKELLEGKNVRLEFDSNKKDEKLVTLAYVFLVDDNTFVNAEILRHGYAHLHIRPPNTKYAELLRKAYREARRELKGLQGF